MCLEYINNFVKYMSKCRLKRMSVSENATYHTFITRCMTSALSSHYMCKIIVDCYFDIKEINLLRMKVICIKRL
jgi:hypothetical protein